MSRCPKGRLLLQYPIERHYNFFEVKNEDSDYGNVWGEIPDYVRRHDVALQTETLRGGIQRGWYGQSYRR
jgi:hypothetical protein